jgi:hypothetical protein
LLDGLSQSINHISKELTNQGIGTQVKRADPVLPNDEQTLWDSGVFNKDLSAGLTRTYS